MKQTPRGQFTSPSPDRVVLSAEAADRLVGRLSAPQLHEFFSRDPELFKECFRGFKLDRKNAGRTLIRQRFRTELVHQAEMAGLLLRAPAVPWNGWRQALKTLDEHWLLGHWRELARTPDDLLLLAAAMATDPRVPVAERGRRLLRRHALWPPDRPISKRAIPPAWCALTDLLRSPAEAPAPPPPEATTPENPRRVQALEQRLERLKAERDAARVKIEKTVEKHRIHACQWNEKQRELTARVRKLETENVQLAAAIESETKRRTLEFRRQFLGLAGIPAGLGKHIDALPATGQTLLDRVDAVLDRQASHDKVNGVCSDISREIEQLEAALERLAESARNSLSVLPELNETRRDVEEQLDQLRSLLRRGNRTEENDIVEHFLRQVRGATPDKGGIETLQDLEHLLGLRPFRTLVGNETARELRGQVARRREQIEAILREKELTIAAPPEKNDGTETAFELLDFSREIQQTRRTGQKAVVVVDGYNVIKGVPALDTLGQSRGLAEARHRFERLCARALPNEQVEIVYDGDGSLTTTAEAPGGITVLFAGRRTVDQNADNLIVSRLPETADPAKPVWVVSADGGLRWRTRSRCQAWIDPMDFYRHLIRTCDSPADG